jgi:hypothetical protein
VVPLLSHNNHFKFGYDGDWFSFRKNLDQKWQVQYGPCTKEPLDFYGECLRTAEVIRQDAGDQPITVLFSGGADSEVALRSFVDAKIPVTATILRFKNDLNIHDISYAVIACERLNVPYRIIDLDLLDFWLHHKMYYARPTYCISPHLLTTMWLVDQVKEYPVMGSGECLLVKDIPETYQPGISPYERSEWYLLEKEKIAAWYRHFMVRQRPGCPGFFQYTPEIILSYLRDPFVKALVEDQIPGKLSTESSKLKIYQYHFTLADRTKYTGFERVPEEDRLHRAELVNSFPGTGETAETSVTQLLKELAVNL